MAAWLLALLNPLNWLKIASVIQSIIGAIGSLIDQYAKWRAEQKKSKIDAAEAEMKKANEISDDQLRIKEKMDAMCKLEKVSDPNSTCDGGNGD
jgi:hypothetical protein